jgi:type VI secretion system protein ImpK
MSSDARLLWIAEPVLQLAVQLRATRSIRDLQQLRERMIAILLEFQESARAAGIAESRVLQASEILAALIDHAVTSMPWGAEAGWQSVSTSPSRGGMQRPAQRLLDIARASSSDPDSRELISIAVLLGFDKRSRGPDDAQIEQLLAPPPSQVGDQRLSPEGASTVQRRTVLSNWLPLWVTSCVTVALLAVLFFSLEISLGAKSDLVYARVAGLNRPVLQAQRPQPASSPRLAAALSSELARSSLFVRDEVDRSYILVSDTKLFVPGDAALRAESTGLLRTISRALQTVPGQVQVISHTDRGTERSARFPSDWDLSVDRARAVHQALRGFGVTSLAGYDGRGSIEPLAAQDSARAVTGNGRIEIVLLVGR